MFAVGFCPKVESVSGLLLRWVIFPWGFVSVDVRAQCTDYNLYQIESKFVTVNFSINIYNE